MSFVPAQEPTNFKGKCIEYIQAATANIHAAAYAFFCADLNQPLEQLLV
jgi:hypothetical protein